MSLLKLGRREGEAIQVGENITVTVEKIRGRHIRLSIEAPKEVRIMRQELLDENQRAA